MIERGRAPRLWEVVQALDSSVPAVLQSLTRLEANHGFVPHPGTVDPWVIHPFSTTPTPFYVSNSDRGWWAPCIWCAFGIGALVGGSVDVVTTFGGEGERCRIRFDGARVESGSAVAHFPIPVARAWDNVHRHCAETLVFESEDTIDAWCDRHGVAKGEVVPLQQVADLAVAWYGGHLDPNWRKATPTEAAAVFDSVGLTSEHWLVPRGSERF